MKEHRTPGSKYEFEVRSDVVEMARRALADPIALNQLIEGLRRDPLLWQLVQSHRGRCLASPITEPWQAYAEQKAIALHMLAEPDTVHMFMPSGPNRAEFHRVLAVLLIQPEVQTFAWSNKILDIVKACPLPDHVVSPDVLPFPMMYHSFESAYVAEIRNAVGMSKLIGYEITGGLLNDSLFFLPLPDGFLIASFLSDRDGHGDRMVSLSDVRFGSRFPDDFTPDELPYLSQVFSMLAFLNSPYTDVVIRKMPRAWRRRGEIKSEDRKRTVHTVVLRASSARAVKQYDSDRRIEWKHRWWVRGHFRAQWYPSRKAHEVIWIAPHLKGPDDAPMVEKTYVVKR